MKSKKTVKKNMKWHARAWHWVKDKASHIACWHCVEQLGIILLGGALLLNCLSVSTVAGIFMIGVGLKGMKH